jgi:hypothetical protein
MAVNQRTGIAIQWHLFYVCVDSIQVEHTPNIVTKLTREAEWAQQHPDIMGPSNSFLYFGPSKTPGYLVYGNLPSQAMADSLRQKKDTSTFVCSELS